MLRLLLLAAGVLHAGVPAKTTVTFPDGSAILAETARTPEEQTAALRDRTGIDPEAGILLEFPHPGERVFPAEAVRNSLDLLFLDAKGRVTSAQTYGVLVDSIGEGTYILALEAGSIEKRGLKAGQRVRIGTPKKKRKAAKTEETAVLPTDQKPDPDQVNREMMESLETLKGKVPDAMYQQMIELGAKTAAAMKADPNADPAEILKTLTGMDVNKMADMAKELRRQNPQITDEEIARKLAPQMMQDLAKPKAAAEPKGSP